ncbi:MAG: alpha/beta fold hydrolase [Anaerolineaceae bacterium]|nr:alpha/beta fold hydrolase [Anaerolineaceae bacterium]
MQNKFPYGIESFTRNQMLNFELNRWYGFGLGRAEDIHEAARDIRKPEDSKMAFWDQAKKAEREGRMANAAIYYHAAEFYIPREDPDKAVLYDKFLETFYKGFADEQIENFQVPYENSFLYGFRLLPESKTPRGTILFHGGFDSLLEEMYYITDHFRQSGYEVIAFEGPGQGYTLRKYGLPLTHDWEKPVGAVLDHFECEDVTIIGASLGGYWCLRAAAFEPRIKRVIAYGLVYDFMALPNDLIRKMTGWFMSKPKLMESSVKFKMKVDSHHRWITNHWAFITHSQSVGEVPAHMLSMNQEHMHPERITQDVLLLTGEEDEFFPAKLLEKQKANLKNAKSVTTRLFTREENASHHCQIGNVQLALNTMVSWLNNLER